LIVEGDGEPSQVSPPNRTVNSPANRVNGPNTDSRVQNVFQNIPVHPATTQIRLGGTIPVTPRPTNSPVNRVNGPNTDSRVQNVLHIQNIPVHPATTHVRLGGTIPVTSRPTNNTMGLGGTIPEDPVTDALLISGSLEEHFFCK